MMLALWAIFKKKWNLSSLFYVSFDGFCKTRPESYLKTQEEIRDITKLSRRGFGERGGGGWGGIGRGYGMMFERSR